MSESPESVLSLTPETVADMTTAQLRKIAALEIRLLLETYQAAGRARSWPGALVFGLLLPQFTGTAKDVGGGCLNILIPFLGPGHLMSGSYILWLSQLLLCVGLPLFVWPGHAELGYAIAVSYACGILFNILSVFVLKKLAFFLRWLKLLRKLRRGLSGLHAGTKEIARPFFAKDAEYTAFCADLDIRETQYQRLLESLGPKDVEKID